VTHDMTIWRRLVIVVLNLSGSRATGESAVKIASNHTVMVRNAHLAFLLVLTMSGKAYAQRIITFDAPKSGTHSFQGTQATGINLEGTVTGNVTDDDNGTHGFVRTREAQFTYFDAPGANPVVGGTFPNGVNDCGELAGNFIDANSVSHGFVRSRDGELTTFDDSHAPVGTSAYQGTTPVGINDLGVIAGTYTDGNNITHGFVRARDGHITDFDPRGSTYTQVGGGQQPWADRGGFL
jgi:hypothetical protein